jgi:hypothetical protein
MLQEYKIAVESRQTIPASSDAIGEMSTFVLRTKGENSTYRARSGCYDDRVMARAICWQMTKGNVAPKSRYIAVRRRATSYSYV